MSEVLLGGSAATTNHGVGTCETAERTSRRLSIRKLVAVAVAAAAFGGGALASEAGAAGAVRNQTRAEATAAKAKLMTPEQIENRAYSVVGADWLLSAEQPGGAFGPQILDGGTSAAGDLKEFLLAPHTFELTGPCTFDDNYDSYLFDSPAGITSRSCADTSDTGRSVYSRSSVRSLCYDVVELKHEETYAQCDNVSFGRELLTVGDQVAASAGLAADRYGPARRIEVLSDVKTRTVHGVNAGLPYTEVLLVSDVAVSATIDFANDHNPGHQLKQLEIENTRGHLTDHVRWY